MKKSNSPFCLLCEEVSVAGSPAIDNREHFLLSCPAFSDTREDFLAQFVNLSPALNNHMEVSTDFLVCLLDPYSPRVPEDVRQSWHTGIQIIGVEQICRTR